VPDGWLPVYSVDTEKEARALLVFSCQTNADGEFVARELVGEQTVENLVAFGRRLAEAECLMKSPKTPRKRRAEKPAQGPTLFPREEKGPYEEGR
jgi:hypothetical protein